MHFSPLTILLIFLNAIKKNISPPIKIKPKQHTQKKKSEPVLMRYLCSLGVGNTQLIKGKKKKGISKPFPKKKRKKKKGKT